ncbi:MAG: SrfA family protein [Desulfovibrionaceae bacterium]|nr:SrfA family protein [Desulfovibrionaceae bacterium]
MNTHFATSQRNTMRPLAFEGLLITDCYDQLHTFLVANQAFLSKHGMAHAHLFLAEPMYDPATGQIDWYTTAKEKPVPLADLPEAEQQALLARTQQCLNTISALVKNGAGRHDIAASFLSLAIIHPGDQDIYSAGGTPVLINWGFEESSAAQPEHIMRLGGQDQPRPAQPQPQPQPVPEAVPEPQPVPVQDTHEAAVTPPPVPPVPPAAARSYTGCLPYLLPLLLAILLIWLLLAILGLLPSPLPASCFHQAVPMDSDPARSEAWDSGKQETPDQGLDSELARSRVLAQKADNLIERLRAHQALCVPKDEPRPVVPDPPNPPEEPMPPVTEPAPPAEEPAVPMEEPKQEEPAPPAEESKPLAENEMPDFGAPAVVPEKEEKEERPKAAKKGEAMQIPEDAAKKKDLSFLEGCWRSVTGLMDANTGQPIKAEYCFSRNGRGHRKIIKYNGETCTGPLKARFKGNKLTIDAKRANCPGRGYFIPQRVQCEGTDSSTQCYGEELDPGGNNNSWGAGFVRK